MDLLGSEIYLDGFSDGRTWNGWDYPFFTFDQALKVLDAFRNVRISQNLQMDAKYPEGEFECFGSVIVDGQKLYPIGAGCWIWERAGKWD
jgi:hypothetical protein